MAIALIGLAGLALWQAQPGLPVLAAVSTPTPTPSGGPARKTVLHVPFTSYAWWVLSWQTNAVLCQLWVEHDGLPKAYEVSSYCDANTYSLYAATPPCPQAQTGGDTRACAGVYLHFAGSGNYTRDVTVDLPPPTVGVTVSGCDLTAPGNRCSSLPTLVLTGEEPLPNESIIAIHGTLGDQPFDCQGPVCSLPIPPTGTQGLSVEFWADSSYGDSSQHFTAQVRAIPVGDFMAPDGKSRDQQSWYVNVISSQWRGAPLASCSAVWDAFPDVKGPPGWLTTPDRVDELATNEPLYYLAGVLIEHGDVDASGCPNGGLVGSGIANECGLERAGPKMTAWQNQFDTKILRVAKETGVPAQLMKNIFYRESQFWPGIYQTYHEAGLGQLTSNGAETTLLWNPDFFNQFCPLVFQKDICNLGWPKLSATHREVLKGALVTKVNAACPDCPAGIDVPRANFSINVFAESLRANCEQVGQEVYNVTRQSPGVASSYDNLWLFTLANYNVGPGCLTYAMNQAVTAHEPLDWPHVGSHLTAACTGAIPYIEAVTGVEAPSVSLTATAQAPTPPTPVFLATHAPTATLAATTPAAQATAATASPTPGGTQAATTPATPGYPYPAPNETLTPIPGYP